MFAQTTDSHPDRIEIFLTPIIGPLTQDGPLAAFDPRRDVEVYVDGDLVPVRSAFFNSVQNSYVLFMDRTINVHGIIQVIHHIPNPPFEGTVNPILYDLTLGEDPDIDEGV